MLRNRSQQFKSAKTCLANRYSRKCFTFGIDAEGRYKSWIHRLSWSLRICISVDDDVPSQFRKILLGIWAVGIFLAEILMTSLKSIYLWCWGIAHLMDCRQIQSLNPSHKGDFKDGTTIILGDIFPDSAAPFKNINCTREKFYTSGVSTHWVLNEGLNNPCSEGESSIKVSCSKWRCVGIADLTVVAKASRADFQPSFFTRLGASSFSSAGPAVTHALKTCASSTTVCMHCQQAEQRRNNKWPWRLYFSAQSGQSMWKTRLSRRIPLLISVMACNKTSTLVNW